jgi:vacuolar-type H+-ATPase subunit H
MEQLAHLMKRETHAVEEIDPAHPLHRRLVVEAEAAARPGGRLE